MMKTMRAVPSLLLSLAVGTVVVSSAAPVRKTPVYGYRIVHTYPHDRSAFTQGLEYRGGFLYEGTGLNGHSGIRKVELETGKVLQQVPLEQQYFGEGIALLDQRIIELTWRSQRGFIYDRDTFRRTGSFDYPGEGWGLTHDGTWLIMSDGTSRLRFLDPATFTVRRVLDVTDGARPVDSLNELEFVRGEVYANVWPTDWMVRIDPVSGRVVGRVDLTGLLAPHERRGTEDVANGIAYDASGDRLFLTGKLWPRLYEVRLRRR